MTEETRTVFRVEVSVLQKVPGPMGGMEISRHILYVFEKEEGVFVSVKSEDKDDQVVAQELLEEALGKFRGR